MSVTARDSDLSDYKLLSSGGEMSTAAFIESNFSRAQVFADAFLSFRLALSACSIGK